MRKLTVREFFQRFERKENGCLEWQLATDKDGYGRTGFCGKNWFVHRLVWRLKRGRIPRGMLVLHHCDNPPCGEIEHLYLGTHARNALDKVERNRCHDQRGDRNASAKLTWEKVREIRRLATELSLSEMAERFNVTASNVSYVLKRKTWREDANR